MISGLFYRWPQKFIEVKTTKSSALTDFLASFKRGCILKEQQASYIIYRFHKLRRESQFSPLLSGLTTSAVPLSMEDSIPFVVESVERSRGRAGLCFIDCNGRTLPW